MCVIALATMAVLGGVLSATYADNGNGTLIVHFYNGEGEYEYSEWGGKPNVTWGAYYWIDIGRIVPATGYDDDFYKGDNKGQYFTIKLNATESSAVKSGKKLGLIMVRSYYDETNTFSPYWNSNKGKDLPADRFITVDLTDSDTSEIWIIAGDKNNYTSLESAMEAFERIESARFDDFGKIHAQTTSPVAAGKTGYTIRAINADTPEGDDGEIVAQGKITSAYGDELRNSYIFRNRSRLRSCRS